MTSDRSRLASAAYFCGVAGLASLLIGILGIQIRLFPPMLGFGLFALGTIIGGITATLLGAVALIRRKKPAAQDDQKRALIGTGLGLALLALLYFSAGTAGDAPSINDITTDLSDPPSFAPEDAVPTYAGRDMGYPPEFVAIVQTHYPDLASMKSPLAPDAAYALALATAEKMGLDIVWKSASERRFDATDVTATFRFVDDFTVRVRPSGSGSEIDVRSKSRDGQGDLGTNARRIRKFLDNF